MLDTLRATKLPEWGTLRDGEYQPEFKQALAEAAKVLSPKPSTLSWQAVRSRMKHDLETWLSQTGALIRQKLKDGPVIMP